MIFRRLSFALALLAGAACFGQVSPARAGTLLGNGTLNVADDLTRIDVGGTVLEFLDLTATNGFSVVTAVSTYGAAGFSWATGAQLTELLSAFGITYASAANAVTDLGATATQANNFTLYLGTTTNGGAAVGWVDDLTTVTHHTYICISSGSCGPPSFTHNTASFWPETGIVGVFLVREAAAVPEPASLALLPRPRRPGPAAAPTRGLIPRAAAEPPFPRRRGRRRFAVKTGESAWAAYIRPMITLQILPDSYRG